jgi:DUF4097 and DUF4098 domain-containing protein YvlB
MPTTIEIPTETTARSAPRRRGRTALLTTGAATGALALVIGALTVANHAMTERDNHEFTADNVRELVIDQDAGDVTLVAGSVAGEVRVETSRRWAWNKPGTGHTMVDGVLTLTGDCPAFGFGSCDVDQRVTVPAGTRVLVDVDAGSVHAANLDVAAFDVETDSGNIHAAGITVPTFRAGTSSGSVEASFTAPPKTVTAHTSSGHITLAVPDAVYNVDAGTSSGEVRIEVPQDPDSTRGISAHTSSGDVTVTRR